VLAQVVGVGRITGRQRGLGALPQGGAQLCTQPSNIRRLLQIDALQADNTVLHAEVAQLQVGGVQAALACAHNPSSEQHLVAPARRPTTPASRCWRRNCTSWGGRWRATESCCPWCAREPMHHACASTTSTAPSLQHCTPPPPPFDGPTTTPVSPCAQAMGGEGYDEDAEGEGCSGAQQCANPDPQAGADPESNKGGRASPSRMPSRAGISIATSFAKRGGRSPQKGIDLYSLVDDIAEARECLARVEGEGRTDLLLLLPTFCLPST
jgi:hypothetical protein